MPNSIIKSFAKKSNKSIKEVEKLWHKAKDIAKDEGHEDEYDYIVGILKRMLSLNENLSFSEFLECNLNDLEETTSSSSIPNVPYPLHQTSKKKKDKDY